LQNNHTIANPSGMRRIEIILPSPPILCEIVCKRSQVLNFCVWTVRLISQPPNIPTYNYRFIKNQSGNGSA
jgi:hypothetical protein